MKYKVDDRVEVKNGTGEESAIGWIMQLPDKYTPYFMVNFGNRKTFGVYEENISKCRRKE